VDYLLDTSIARPVFEQNERVAGRLASLGRTDRIYTSVVTEGELLFGVERLSGQRKDALSRQVTAFLRGLTDVVLITRDAARVYGLMRRELELLGRPIPVNDLWIAAVALNSDFTLVAHDKDFGHVGGLKLEDWLA
jgi:tRNA(fMet)-specific endonuclease VapC